MAFWSHASEFNELDIVQKLVLHIIFPNLSCRKALLCAINDRLHLRHEETVWKSRNTFDDLKQPCRAVSYLLPLKTINTSRLFEIITDLNCLLQGYTDMIAPFAYCTKRGY